MSTKYEPLRRYLEAQPADDVVSLTMYEIAGLVGGLPPSSAGRTWWANTDRHPQSLAWLQAGRRVMEVRLGHSIVFSPASATPFGPRRVGGGSGARDRAGLPPVMDGVAALERSLKEGGYASILEAIAAHTLFLHPDTVTQTSGQPVFPVVRDPTRRPNSEYLELCSL